MNEPTDTEHPGTEALSALIDGEGPGWSSHVDACPRCRNEIAGLRAVRAALAEPVPVPSGVLENALSAALAAYSAASPGPTTGASVEPASLPPVPDPRFAIRRGWLIAGSVAAMLALVLVVVPLLRDDDRVSRKTSRDSSALRSTARPDATEGAGGTPGEGFAADQPAAQSAAVAAELGEVGGPEELKARLGPVLTTRREQLSSPLVAPEDAGRGKSPAPAAPPAAATAASPASACVEAARATAAAPLGALVYEAAGFSGGIPVVVLAFSASDATAPVNLLVLTREGCRPVFSVRYP
jgi:hypothetical protein